MSPVYLGLLYGSPVLQYHIPSICTTLAVLKREMLIAGITETDTPITGDDLNYDRFVGDGGRGALRGRRTGGRRGRGRGKKQMMDAHSSLSSFARLCNSVDFSTTFSDMQDIMDSTITALLVSNTLESFILGSLSAKYWSTGVLNFQDDCANVSS